MVDPTLSFVELFREAFEGRPEGQDYTWFVEGREGIFDAFAHTSATQASTRPSPTCNTIGAHLNHVRYTLMLANASIRGEDVESDWEGSWAKQEFDDAEWHQLEADLRAEYATVLAYLESRPDWPDQEWFTGTLAWLPHVAYHLGAVRQLMKVV